MRIAVNTRFLLYQNLSGFGVFINEIFSRLVKEHPDIEFTFIFDRPYHQSFIYNENVKAKVLFPPARHPIFKFIYYQISLQKFINRNNFDLFISPDSELPLHLNCPTLLVLHDINFFHNPNYLSGLNRRYMTYFTPKYLKAATHIVTVSEFCKKDIENYFPFTKNKIGVVYNAASDYFKPLTDNEIQINRNKYSNRKPYFLFIGAITPRKNLANLIKAYNIYRKNTNQDYPLIIVGGLMHKDKALDNELKNTNYKSDIYFLGNVSNKDIAKIVGSAFALVFPSQFEGFGIPIVEAMKAGIPVITSNISSMPEIAGNAALFVDPFNPESIADAMISLSTSQTLYDDLKIKALQRVKNFSWEQSTDKMWKEIKITLDKFYELKYEG